MSTGEPSGSDASPGLSTPAARCTVTGPPPERMTPVRIPFDGSAASGVGCGCDCCPLALAAVDGALTVGFAAAESVGGGASGLGVASPGTNPRTGRFIEGTLPAP